ncbi:MAG: ABC transporter permease [Chloroflexota bacterium]|nr:ABC transporter permease [Chloroflexota bacterium]
MGFGLVGPFLIHQEATRTTAFAKDLPPSLTHILGTDSFGRDIMALIVVGTPQTVKVGLIAGVIALAVGSFLGFAQGYYRGAVGALIRGITDVMLTIPALLILITIASQVRVVSVEGMALIIAALSWPGATRAMGSQVLTLRERAFVSVARLNGMSGPSIIIKELMPNMLPYIGASFVQAVSVGILFAIGLEVLGLGPQTTNTLGMTIYWSQLNSAVIRGLVWWWLSPVAVVVVLFIGLFLISKGLDEMANPRLRSRV